MAKAAAGSIVDSSRRLNDASLAASFILSKEEASKSGGEFDSNSDSEKDRVRKNVKTPPRNKKTTSAARVHGMNNRDICMYNDNDLDRRSYSVSSRLAEDGDRTASICSDASAKGNACGNCEMMFCQRDGDASIAHSGDLAELRKDVNEMKRMIKPSERSLAESERQCKENDGDGIWPKFLQCFPTNYVGMCISWDNFQQEGQYAWDDVSEITTNKESSVWNDDYPYAPGCLRVESSKYSSNFRSRSSHAGSTSTKPSSLLSNSITSNPLRLGNKDKAKTVKARKVVEGHNVRYEV
ncbi:hypothetical protein HJC23_012695 [Cyclotella cryptica]|uniref:Uncharacterized protein n=1 Tax=Cyclotella cryptica TaxID=29204 RepID=A0ABD3PLU5_9STRA